MDHSSPTEDPRRVRVLPDLGIVVMRRDAWEEFANEIRDARLRSLAWAARKREADETAEALAERLWAANNDAEREAVYAEAEVLPTRGALDEIDVDLVKIVRCPHGDRHAYESQRKTCVTRMLAAIAADRRYSS